MNWEGERMDMGTGGIMWNSKGQREIVQRQTTGIWSIYGACVNLVQWNLHGTYDSDPREDSCGGNTAMKTFIHSFSITIPSQILV